MEEEKGITAGEIFRLIKNRIFWILAISAFAALAAALLTSLVYNRTHEEFYLSFVVDLPQEASFRYETIVFADNLEAAKSSDAAFSDINTDRMAANEDIRIVRIGEEEELPLYRVSVKGRYFSDRDQATNFLRAMIGHALSRVPVTLAKHSVHFLPSGAHMRIEKITSADGIVRYRQNTVSVADNKKSPLLAAFAGFVIAFLAASAVFCMLDYNARESVRRKDPLPPVSAGKKETQKETPDDFVS